LAKIHHVKRALKDRPDIGVRKGDPYFWWWRRTPGQRARGTKHFSRTPPTASQMAGSPLVREVLAMQESMIAVVQVDADDSYERAREIVGRLGEMLADQREATTAIPNSLRRGRAAEIGREREEAIARISLNLREFISGQRELEDVDWSIE
jgi:hypothetical protein